MKRATGPGKVEELLAPPGRDDLVQGALLLILIWTMMPLSQSTNSS